MQLNRQKQPKTQKSRACHGSSYALFGPKKVSLPGRRTFSACWGDFLNYTESLIRGSAAEPRHVFFFSLSLRKFCCAELWEIWAEVFAELVLLWMSQQNKPENVAKNFAPSSPKTSPRTAPIQKANFSQNFALQKPFAKDNLEKKKKIR